MNLRPLYNQIRENKGRTAKQILNIDPWNQIYNEVRIGTWVQIFLAVASPTLRAIK